MIDFRYPLVSLIAVFLAIALGVIIGTTALVVLVLAALFAIASALWVSSAGRVYLDLLVDQWNSFVFWLENLFS